MRQPLHIVITGASSGIGAALTHALSADGHHLYVCARRASGLAEITKDGTVAMWRTCDVSQERDVAEFVEWVAEHTRHVNALINCAAVVEPIGPVLETNSQQWLNTITINLFGTYLMVKFVVPLMEKAERPRIIAFSGGGAFNAFPNYSAYAVSKAAVVRLTENLAIELAPFGIKVNAVAPGFVATPIHEDTMRAGPDKAGEEYFQYTKRLLREGAVPMEVPVACVRFLLSEQAGDLTGKTISASFDPWGTHVFQERIAEINQSDLYTLRRINLVNLPDAPLRTALSTASRHRDGS